MFDKWGKNLSHKKKMQYNYSQKIFTGTAKPIRIIGDPDNQLPDNWSSTVILTFDVHFTLAKHLLKPK